MAFLTIAAKTYPVLTTGASGRPPTYVGAVVPTFVGGRRRTVRATKREWAFTIGPVFQQELETLVADCGNEKPVAVGGDALGVGASMSAAVILGEAPYIEDASQSTGFRRFQNVVIREL